jgi:hypothetical protein
MDFFYFSNNRHQHFKQKIHKTYCYLWYLSLNLYTIANVAEVHNKRTAWHIFVLSYRCESKQLGIPAKIYIGSYTAENIKQTLRFQV